MEAKFHAEVNPRIKDLTQALDMTRRDMQTILTAIDIEFTRKESRLFASQGASGGPRWRPLSARYAKQKRRKRPGRKILTYDGNLRDSLRNRRDSDHISRASGSKNRATFTVGTRNRVAAYHAPGLLHNPRLPVRDPIQHTRAQENDYKTIVRTYIVDEKMKRALRAMSAWRRKVRGI